jgi:hypothetical protein
MIADYSKMKENVRSTNMLYNYAYSAYQLNYDRKIYYESIPLPSHSDC